MEREKSVLKSLRIRDSQNEFIGMVRSSVEALKRLGFDVKDVSKAGLESLMSRQDDELRLKIGRMQAALQDILVAESMDGLDDRGHLNERVMEAALKRMNWRVSDQFYGELQRGRVVEVYGPDMVQMFRSLNFFKYTGYSLLDLSLHEWFVLYERPRSVLGAMHEHVERVLKERLEFHPCSVPEHIMREGFDDGLSEPFEPRCMRVKFANIGVATDDKGAIVGFAVSCETSLVSRGIEANIIGFV